MGRFALFQWLLLLPHCAVAFTCYPEYQFSWCDNTTEASCVHNYAFSVGHFQRKLSDYYMSNRRPPLTEAYFLTKLPRPYQMQFVESGCAAPLIMAYLLVAEAKLPVDDDAEAYASMGQSLINDLPEAIKPFLLESRAWPFSEAIARYERTASDTLNAQRTFPGLLGRAGVISLEFVVVHCRESLTWIDEKLLPIAPHGSALTLYEKCGEQPVLSPQVRERFGAVAVKPCSDPVGGPRGDECLGYLAHLTDRYDTLATFTVFMQADPDEHLHFAFLERVTKMISRSTYAVPFMNLNGARHVRTITPCMKSIHEAIFGEAMREPVGPYCCAQFVVQDAAVRQRPLAFYQNMLRMVDGSVGYDLCTTGQVKRSTHCYGMEFMWHLVFGEDYEQPLRQDDVRLPTPLRLKFGDDHVRRDWNDVVLNPNTPKKIVEQIDMDQVVR
eukprot:TRINITY_DN26376_c0_g2_i1.p1 TRINITY_DN26376_c0_g2~~TRINITY_DN26376_c0_g2_i1.p1  ORF type:complete len:441 (-),score=94.08 TRINITY_DN26376_c0_g2_i1:78-1400(-)